MAARLPDELVKDILHSILDIPDHEFHDTSTQSPFARVVAPSSAALLVCKRWMRIATPLLYHNVVLRSSATAHSFCIAIKRQPEFAKLVKHLRVECPCPNILGDTAKRMTALATLHIDLASIGDNRLLGVAKLLAASNATHLSLARNKPVFNSTGRKKRLDAVIKWTNLVGVESPLLVIQELMLQPFIARPHTSTIRSRFQHSVRDSWLTWSRYQLQVSG